MEESTTELNNSKNYKSNENSYIEEENPLALIASDIFSSGPETKDNESINTNSDDNMVGKIGTIKAASILAKSASVKLTKSKPNYFLSVRLDSQIIQKSFNEFSNYVTNKFPEYKKLLIKPQQIHITLFVLHLGNDDNIENAKNCLLNSKEIMNESCPNGKLSLHFQGIDIFDRGRVVYTIPKNSDDLLSLTKLTYALYERFQQEGLVDNDLKKEFIPHATLVKLRKRMIIKHKDGKKEVVNRIPPEIYEHFRDFDFGTHCVKGVELSSMLLPKDDDGYYMRLEHIEF
ncbi:16714_t:CDS:2 [Funneliformis mosseae]|uniref:16714_t:CDS:1 n=1 Tax=Funneliformis mosseae TaxID=27381 RepID=A0A9N9GGD4_FUNMO|nr:16714_t:CDS:2 [Funneliformis mosseae]